MKKLLSIIAIICSITANAQFLNVYHSTTRHTGIDVIHVTPSKLVFGVGGSYLFGTYTGETKGRYQELSNTYLGDDGNKWSQAFRTNYNVQHFVEDRGAVKLLIGSKIKTTTFYISTGLSFRSEYWKGTGYDAMPGFTSPQKHFYVYRNISPRFLYGVNINQTLAGRLGLTIGYNNVEKLMYGLSYKIIPNKLFR